MKRVRLLIRFGVVLGVLLGALILPCHFQGAKAASAGDPRYIPASQVSLTDWMAKIPDEALLTEINMPATHDSGTTHMNWGVSRPLASCQSWSIKEQLQHGIRVLDIRVAGLKDQADMTQWWKMEITHDVWRCAKGSSSTSPVLTLRDVVEDCAAFLRSHSDEAVVIRLSYEDNKKTAAKSMGFLREAARPEKSYSPDFLNGVSMRYYLPGDEIPVLKDVRGQIVVIDDGSKSKMPDKKDGADSTYEMEYDRDSTGLRATVIATAAIGGPAYLIAQVKYRNDVVDTKESLLKKCFSDAGKQAYTTGHGKKPGVWNLDGYYNTSGRYGEPGLKVVGTNLNTAGKLGPLSPTISDYSDRVNRWLGKYNFQNGKRYGWISMDHPTETVIRKIVATNEVKTESVIVEIDWRDSAAFATKAFGERAFSVGNLDYTQSWAFQKNQPYATLVLDPSVAKELEEGGISLDLSASCPLRSRVEPLTWRMEHIGQNRWKCVLYGEIAVTLHWDLATPATVERLLNGFLTYHYGDGEETTVPSQLIRPGNNTASTTVLYLNLLPEKSADDPLILDIAQSGLEYTYHPDRDRVRKDLRHWEFTLHMGTETADYAGTLFFDDNDDQQGLRPQKGDAFWKGSCKLIATAAEASGEDADGERVVFTVPLSVDDTSYQWTRRDLPLKDEEGTVLQWRLLVYAPRGYTVTYQTEGTQLNATLTTLPFTDVEIRWEGEGGDISNRPGSVAISLWEKSTGKYMTTKAANAQNGWRVRFTDSLLKDDWVLKTTGRTALYEQSGPFITEDGKGAYFVFTRTNEVKIFTQIHWRDGMSVREDHPVVTLSLHNGQEVVRTKKMGGNRDVDDWIRWWEDGTLPAWDSEGKPYTYTIAAEIEEAGRDSYSVSIQGYDVYLVRKTEVTGRLYWQGSRRPAWITEPPTLTLYRRKVASTESYEPVDAEVVWNWEESSFSYSGLPLGVVDGTATSRYQYKVVADAGSLPGVQSVSTSMDYNEEKATYTATLLATLRSVTVTIPFTIAVKDNGFHPRQDFTLILRDTEGTEKAAQTCTVRKNIGENSGQMVLTLYLARTGNYTLEMAPLDGSGWEVDPGVQSVSLIARLNAETGEVEMVPEGEVPAFHVTYTHQPEPVVAEVTFHIVLMNESELAEPPEENFLLQPSLNGEAGETRTVTGAGDLTLSYSFGESGTYEISVDQLAINNWRWQVDEETHSLTVEVSMGEEGELAAAYPSGSESTLKNIYLGDTLRVTGGVLWEDEDFAYGTSLRPENVTLTLVPYQAVGDAATDSKPADSLATLTVPVTEDSMQPFDFGWQKRFDTDGNPIEYTVLEDVIPFYDSTENYFGYSVLNTLSGEMVHAGGIIIWRDEEETYRPSQVIIRLFSQRRESSAVELSSQTVTPDGEGDWWYDFGFYPAKDTDGGDITYFVAEDTIGGYRTKIDDFMVENIKVNYKITQGDGQRYVIGGERGAVFVCDGPFDRFVRLLVDGQEVEKEHYTVAPGSTVLTLKSEWLNHLNTGTHTLRLYYTDGVSDEGKFTVLLVPSTKDPTTPWLYVCLMLLSAATGIGVVLRKQNPRLNKFVR